MSRHYGARHDDGLGAMRGMMFGLAAMAALALVALVAWL